MTDINYNTDESKYYAHEPDSLLAITSSAVDKSEPKTYDAAKFEMVVDGISKGTTSTIHLMKHKKSEYLGVMKVVHKGYKSDATAEISTLKIARGSHFLSKMIDNFILFDSNSKPMFYLFLEYAPFKTLDTLTMAVRGLGSDKSRLYAMETASGLAFLHNRNLMHRDVKAENVFIGVTGHVMLGDLGLAAPSDKTDNKKCGTFLTRPLEVWKNQGYSLPADVWMFGVTLYNIISNKWPFVSVNDERQTLKVEEGKFSFIEGLFCVDSTDLIRKLLVVEPGARLTINEALRHPYLRDIKSPSVPPYTPLELLDILTFGEAEKKIVQKLIEHPQ